MPQTVVLPRQVALISGVVEAGSVLRFYRTGTSTPQSVYTDSALTNPITSATADAAGVFQKLYLNPSADFDYRITLEDSGGVVSYTEDGISRYPVSQSEIGAALYPKTPAEDSADVTPPNLHIPPRTKPAGSIERFLTDAAGNDITLALVDAMAVSAQNKQDIVIPNGDWTISAEGGFPDQYAIRGQGRFSRLMLDLSAGEWAFKYSTVSGAINSWGFENLYFGIAGGGSENVGAIAMIEGQTLRGAYIRDIWADELHRIILMNDVFGSLWIDRLSCKLSSGEADAGNIAVNLTGGTANAVYMRNIELLGLYRTGIKHTGRLFQLEGWNIAGSVASVSELECAVHLLDSLSFRVTDGYIEKMKAQASSFEGWATGNGSATSIIVESTTNAAVYGKIQNINCATGSIYVLGASEVEIEQVNYSEANGGLRVGSGDGAAFADIQKGSVKAMLSALKNQPNGTGFVEILDGNNSGMGYEPNPQLGTWATAPFANISGGTQSDETSDFLSGDRSVKVTCASQFDGVTYTVTLPKASIACTVVAKVKAQTALADVRMDVTGNTTQATGGCNKFKTNAVDEWQTLAVTCSSSTTSVQVRIRNGLAGAATFLIDSVNCFPGQSSFDPSRCVTQTGGQVMTGSATYDPGSFADGDGVTTTVTVTGAALGDYIEGVSFSNNLQGITVTGWVSAANTVSVRFQNESGGVLDLASGTLRARVREA